MKKRTLYHRIAGIQLMISLLWTWPVVGQSAGNVSTTENYRVDQIFAQSNLSTAQLEAFRGRAELLVYEFVDYYNLLREEQLDADMKAILLTEVKDMFYEEQALIRLPVSIDLSTIMGQDFVPLPPLEITAITTEASERNSEGFIWIFKVTIGKQKRIATVRTILSKQLKSFGSTQRLVWDVLLLSWETQ